MEEKHPSTIVKAADAVALLTQHKLRRQAHYRVPSTPITEVLHHLFNKAGVRVDNLARDKTIIEHGFQIFPNDNLRAAAYRINAFSKHFYYLPDHDAEEPTVKITRQKYAHERATYDYSDKTHRLHNSKGKESLTNESMSVAAGSWHDYVRAGDPADPLRLQRRHRHRTLQEPARPHAAHAGSHRPRPSLQ